jgi:hypothetical protein
MATTPIIAAIAVEIGRAKIMSVKAIAYFPVHVGVVSQCGRSGFIAHDQSPSF